MIGAKKNSQEIEFSLESTTQNKLKHPRLTTIRFGAKFAEKARMWRSSLGQRGQRGGGGSVIFRFDWEGNASR